MTGFNKCLRENTLRVALSVNGSTEVDEKPTANLGLILTIISSINHLHFSNLTLTLLVVIVISKLIAVLFYFMCKIKHQEWYKKVKMSSFSTRLSFV